MFFSLFLIAALSLRDPSLSKIAEKLHMQWRIIRGANTADHSATIHSYVEEWIRVPTQWISHGLQVRAVVLDQDSSLQTRISTSRATRMRPLHHR